MSAQPAVTAHILRNFSIAFIGIVGTVAAGTEVYNIASRKDRELTKGWGGDHTIPSHSHNKIDCTNPFQNFKACLTEQS
jgi:hypothetical protein